jgi:hypothetical protein
MSNSSLGFAFIESTEKIKGKLKTKKSKDVDDMSMANMPVAKMPMAKMPVAKMPMAKMPVANMPMAKMPVANMPVAPVSPVMEPFQNEDDSEDEELANVDFSPPPKPESSGVERAKSKERALMRQEQHPAEPFTKMGDDFAKEYYEQYIPFETPQLNTGHHETGSSRTEDLEKKLNYMIHLLEDQKDERTEGITEEIVLYCFLGVFIIFVLDSFAKVGKYVR